MSQITVLLPVHNGGAYLEEALDAVLAQTLADFELLVIDDGSTDDSRERVRRRNDPRIRLLENGENLGLIKTLNRGLEEIRTPYFVRMDADDLCEPIRLERQTAFMDAHPDLVAAGTDYWGFGGDESVARYVTDPEQIRAMLLFQPSLCHACAIFRTAVFREQGVRYREAYPHVEDWDLWRQLAQYGPLGNQSELLYRVRFHAEGVQVRNREVQEASIRRIYREELARLGVEPDADEMAVHVAVGGFYFTGDLVELELAEAWMVRLLAAWEKNDDPWFTGLDREIGRRFWRIVRNHFAASGVEAWDLYRASSLRRFSPASFTQEAWLFLLTLRASMRGGVRA